MSPWQIALQRMTLEQLRRFAGKLFVPMPPCSSVALERAELIRVLARIIGGSSHAGAS